MAFSPSGFGRAASSAQLQTFAIIVFFLLLFAPPVSSSCIDITVTKTVWVTAVKPSLPTSTKTFLPTSSTSNSTILPSSTDLNTISSQTYVPPVPSSTPPVVNPSSSEAESETPRPTYNPMPAPAARIYAAPPMFNRLTPSPNTGSIRNSCEYDVFVSSAGCNGTVSNVKIAAGATWEEPLRRCEDGGVVYKVSKNEGQLHPVMQFEAGVWKDRNIVQYDLSYLDCMIPNTTDLSGCPGWEGGHQAVAGKGCPVFVCKPGEYCDGSSYTVPEFGYQGGGITHPNAGCDSTHGIAFELCACSSQL